VQEDDLLEDNQSSAWAGTFRAGSYEGGEGQGRLGTPRSLDRRRSSDAVSHCALGCLGSLGSGPPPRGEEEFGRSVDALIKPRVHFPAQLSTARRASQE
jgi:hypothetical protein